MMTEPSGRYKHLRAHRDTLRDAAHFCELMTLLARFDNQARYQFWEDAAELVGFGWIASVEGESYTFVITEEGRAALEKYAEEVIL